MNFTNIKTSLTKFAGRSGLLLKKNSPEILLIVGVTGIIGSTVLACRATLKADDVLCEHYSKITTVNEVTRRAEEGVLDQEYTDIDRKKDLALVYLKTSVDFLKLYGPAIVIGAASIGCIIGSHGIMKKRNVALVAAYKAVEEGFASYRKRVVKEYGEEKDYMFKNGLRAEKVTTEVTEDGVSKKIKETKLAGGEPSQYARFFDETCSQWDKVPEYNLMFLKSQQNYLNDMLKARGHVFLNEVYDALGMERSKAGAVVGWVLRKDGEGDNFIDFGLYDKDSKSARTFVNGLDRSVLLDFNVDGLIYDLI